MKAITKTKIIAIDFKKRKHRETILQENQWEVADPNEQNQEVEEHVYCGACTVCDAYKVVCRSDECGACEDCLEFIPYDATLKE